MISSVHMGFILVMTLLGAFAGLMLKTSSHQRRKEAMFGWLMGGLMLYVGAALVNIYLLKYINYSTLFPLSSITYIWTLLLARIVLKEPLNTMKWLGIGCIAFGAVLLV